MNDLLEIQGQLETANQRVVQMERMLREQPDDAVASNLEMAVRIQKKLAKQFHEAAGRAGYDICTYRAFDDNDRPIAGAAFRAVSDFQRMVSIVHGALKHGQKQRATVSGSISRETAFDFGYAMAGSVKIVLTVRNPKLLLGWGELDDAMEMVFAMAKAGTPADVLRYANRLGPGAVHVLYEWASDHAQNGLGAEIEWQKGSDLFRSVLVQCQEWRALRKAIASTSVESQEEMTVTGVLKAADVDKQRFKIQRPGLPIIKGTVQAGAIDEKHRASLPSMYTADLLKRVRTILATGREVVTYHLLRLREPLAKEA